MATAALAERTIPAEHYLNQEFGIKSWLLTKDHKRIGILYLLSITLFFFVGGFFAVMIRLNLLTPDGALVSADTYNKLFTMHGIMMVFFFLVPSIPATLGNFVLPLALGAGAQGGQKIAHRRFGAPVHRRRIDHPPAAVQERRQHLGQGARRPAPEAERPEPSRLAHPAVYYEESPGQTRMLTLEAPPIR